MKMAEYVKAEAGNYFRFYGGSWAWRNHNPGNLWSGSISKKYGSIGVVAHFAVFPIREIGHLALLASLKETYGNSSIDEMMDTYAPPEENDTAKYKKFLHKATGVMDNRKIKDFTDVEFEKLWQGIENFEGYKEGQFVQIYKISQAEKDKNRIICKFYIDNQGWFTKEKCIKLAKKNQVELEVCISCLGHSYLKAASHSSFQKNLKRSSPNFAVNSHIFSPLSPFVNLSFC